ncbi:type II toxin-antitoxin system RelE/ParE family toxin [Streptomyces sp. ISL-94]|uniref:type II toxin-antitoxin system RelE/ParE family toxin n=1 Tax=Streptomyces sp. ISL-94 TaxID=2819190 RepID=UPI001BEC2C0F|nr:type II toxin-antitoxin system RelE/ParE family toxin [Streptomyces sp. ISL-94]MBT2480030.1 type II toxin-antitoxin system RelE/ParE family toxin [Streptomyces sp. ISL-94]
MDWEVIVVEPALSWLHALRQDDRATLIQISKAITALRQEGPAMGRPLVDTVKGSRLANLKELRPGSVGASEVRLLFVFDPLRRAVFLVGGDKAGDWQGWYRSAIPRAEQAYEDYLTQPEEDTP